MDLPDRIKEKIFVEPTKGCWLWQGQINAKGYGMVRSPFGGRMRTAHVTVYRIIRGPIPLGFELDHLCRIRHCCNPWHMEVVPHRINVLRGESPAAKAARATHCPKGHPKDTENTVMRNGWRVCRTCALERSRRFNEEKRKRRGRTQPFLG